jgi:hypothetical protein
MPDNFPYDDLLRHNQANKPRLRRLVPHRSTINRRPSTNSTSERTLACAAEARRQRPGRRTAASGRTRVLCLSPAAQGSGWVRLDCSTVLFRDPANAGRRFIPLLLADCRLPDTLRRYGR